MSSFPRTGTTVRLGAIERWNGHFLVAGAGAGFFERAWVVRGFEEALADSAAEPAFYERLLDELAELESGILSRLLELPVQGILFADDWADQRGILLGRERWRRLVLRRQAALYDTVRRCGKRVLSHCCGNVRDIVPDLVDAGLEVLQSIQPEAMDPYVLKREFGGSLCLWGGLGSQRIDPLRHPRGDPRGDPAALHRDGARRRLHPGNGEVPAARDADGERRRGGRRLLRGSRRHGGPPSRRTGRIVNAPLTRLRRGPRPGRSSRSRPPRRSWPSSRDCRGRCTPARAVRGGRTGTRRARLPARPFPRPRPG